ncbi:hypothetical protein OJ997_20010 [Solirubrobacter phytolaccae]|uniref:Uncharacterized protein n=1 Tax=Solirubrobacter phytolaccae TaxID=1404360 RepID=A0A9X3NEL5_9ACTN|nr:hypothetical protein [Solirubrobacter phytolaccae]MDA0182606.1 hypothetical protein [Solirubrobacter phytolaccae]
MFARQERRGQLPHLISATLHRYREQRLPRPRGFAHTQVGEGNVGPRTIDAVGDRAIVGWAYLPEPDACGNRSSVVFPKSAIALYDLNPRKLHVLDEDCDAPRGGAGFLGPSIDGRFAYYGFDPADQPDANRSIRRVELESGVVVDTSLGAGWVRATQTSGGWTWTVTDAPRNRFAITRVAAPPS